MVTPRDIILRLDKLDQRHVCEMYALLIPRAMEMNPLKEWTIKANPTVEDLTELVRVLPPADCQNLEDLYFS